MKMMQGASCCASVKTARTRRFASPSHLDMIELAVMLRKKQPLSRANACGGHGVGQGRGRGGALRQRGGAGAGAAPHSSKRQMQ